jgi:ABC-type Fe3+/spermidine/putrescine transport system ATPase subunit
MFQDFALFPHLSIAENVAFGLRMAGWPAGKITERVDEMLALVNLEGYGERTVFEASGGERQRVALARSLAPRPQLLMLDEPLGSLDRSLREALVEELRTILKSMNVTALYVTHDQDEALALGDRIVIMNAGRIEQVGAPAAIYTHPATDFVARFLGFANLLPVQVSTAANGWVETPLGPFPLPEPSPTPGHYTLLIRPEAARLAPEPAALARPPRNSFRLSEGDQVVVLDGVLAACIYRGREYRVQIEAHAGLDSYTLVFDLPAFQRDTPGGGLEPNQLPPPGAPITLLIYPGLASFLPADPASLTR